MPYALSLNESITRETDRYHQCVRAIDRWSRITTRMLRQRIEREQDQFPAEVTALEAHLALRLLNILDFTAEKHERNSALFLRRLEKIHPRRMAYLSLP
ncbi:unnamed protein product [Rhizoctonia solani]|uniref:Uncharacterized protein n=1 Tax=Rhizoctonia solani TaxID=456999 RepID=A0A8H3E819_9AGAM|nr:unnamed protein product [Rhizoctonia solani]